MDLPQYFIKEIAEAQVSATRSIGNQLGEGLSNLEIATTKQGERIESGLEEVAAANGRIADALLSLADAVREMTAQQRKI